MASDVDLGQSPDVGIGRAELETLYADEWPRLVRVAYLLTMCSKTARCSSGPPVCRVDRIIVATVDGIVTELFPVG